MKPVNVYVLKALFKLYLLLFFLTALSGFSQINQKAKTNWSVDPFENKEFIENKGQFLRSDILSDDSIYFSVNRKTQIYFTPNGIVYKYDELKHKFSERQIERLEHKGDIAKAEAAEKELVRVPHFLRVNFDGANPNVQIIAQEQLSYYCTYPDRITPFSNKTIKADVFKKITYKNIYPNIDIEFYFPKDKGGIKYNVILHPGADVSKVKMRYSGQKNIELNKSGDVVIESEFGEFIDHAPKTFYSDGTIIKSAFELSANAVSFKLNIPATRLRAEPPFSGQARNSKPETITIDPWVTDPFLTNLDRVYDVTFDKNGNVYGYGGNWPYYESVKLNSTGAIQWKYSPTNFGSYYGDFLVDYNTGSMYMFDGFNFAGAPAVKVNGLGVQVASFAGTSDLSEFWRAAYNNCTKSAVVAGGGVVGAFQTCVLDSNLATVTPVNVLSAPGALHDMALLTIDNASNAYMLAARSVTDPTFADNVMLKAPAATLTPNTFLVSTGHTFVEVGSVKYVGAWAGTANGFNGIAVNNNFLLTYDGYKIKKWNKNTGAFVQQKVVGTDSFAYGGLELSECDRIYAGIKEDIQMFDASLNSVGSIALTDTVFDIKLGDSNTIYASGIAYIASVTTPETCISADTLSGSVVSTDVCGGTLGTAAVIATGGSGGTYYSYTWSNGPSTQTIINLTAGTYTVTVSDQYAKACAASIPLSKVFVVTINTGNPPIIDSIVTVSPLCGNGNGTVTAYASGVAGPILYDWGSGYSVVNTTTLPVGNYTLSVSDNGACPVTGTFTITGPPLIFVNASQNKPDSCGNNTGVAITLPTGGTGALGIQWSTGPITNTISGLAAGTYSVTITDANGCKKDSVVTIGTVGAVIANAGNDVTICRGQSTNLLASGGTTYIWSPGASLSNPTISNPVATPTVTTNYTVTVATGMCTSKDIVRVTVVVPPTIDSISKINPLCGTGAGIAVVHVSGVSGTIICDWGSGPSGLTGSGLAAGTYTVTVNENGACPVTATVGITIPPLIVVNPTQTAADTCFHNTGIAITTVGGGTGALTPIWNPGGVPGLTISSLAAGVYTVTVTDANSCTSVKTVAIASVGAVPANAGPDVGICIGASTTLSASGGNSYEWNPGATLSDSLIANPVATPTVTTNYTLTATVGLCKGKDVVTVTVNLPPVVNAGSDQIITEGTSTQLGASGGVSYLWTPAGSLSNAGIYNPIASPTKNTTYTVTVTDANGCVNVDSLTIFVEELLICGPDDFFVPTAFSPNNDGQNDILYVKGKSNCIKKFSFQIFDRWGERIFETGDYTAGWTGVFNDQLMDTGVFVYKLDILFFTGDTLNRNGNVTLLR